MYAWKYVSFEIVSLDVCLSDRLSACLSFLYISISALCTPFVCIILQRRVVLATPELVEIIGNFRLSFGLSLKFQKSFNMFQMNFKFPKFICL